MSDLLAVQPPPLPATGDLWAEFIADAVDVLSPELLADMETRRAEGIARYGTPLQLGNGRDFGADCYQELLDGAVYSWGKAREQTPDTAEAVEWADIAYGAADLAERVRVACGRVS